MTTDDARQQFIEAACRAAFDELERSAHDPRIGLAAALDVIVQAHEAAKQQRIYFTLDDCAVFLRTGEVVS